VRLTNADLHWVPQMHLKGSLWVFFAATRDFVGGETAARYILQIHRSDGVKLGFQSREDEDGEWETEWFSYRTFFDEALLTAQYRHTHGTWPIGGDAPAVYRRMVFE
jgi:hypothetical protein